MVTSMKRTKVTVNNVNVKLAPDEHQALRMYCVRERVTAQRVVKGLIVELLKDSRELVNETPAAN